MNPRSAVAARSRPPAPEATDKDLTRSVHLCLIESVRRGALFPLYRALNDDNRASNRLRYCTVLQTRDDTLRELGSLMSVLQGTDGSQDDQLDRILRNQMEIIVSALFSEVDRDIR